MYLCFCLIERMISLNIIYKKATIDDIVLLTKTRIEVLRAANNLTSDIDMDEVERKTYEYYKEAFQNDTHTAYIVFEDNKFVGAGGVSYYQVMPTYHNQVSCMVKLEQWPLARSTQWDQLSGLKNQRPVVT